MSSQQMLGFQAFKRGVKPHQIPVFAGMTEKE
jgi:hypothetical protein